MRDLISLTTAVLLLAAAPALADDLGTDPALGVARISIVAGDVAVMRSDSGDWIAAKPNMPLIEGDAVHVGTAARAEIQLAYRNFLRLGSDTEIDVVELGARQFRVRLLEGTAIYSELSDGEADTDIETPMAAVRPMKAGRYIVSVQPAVTHISVPKGRTEVAFQVTSHILERGRTMVVRDGPAGVEFDTRKGIESSELNEWAADRDREFGRSRSYQYVSQDIFGADQLDQYGEWRYVSGVGHSWFPYVTVSWSPYRHGTWNWVDYFGWTWIGAEPWGWAPYHWGRWYRHAIYGWAWYPGAPGLRHIWRPALVTFFGVGSRLRGSYGGVGWCPLAPGEVYRPWYGRRLYSGAGPGTIIVDNSVRVYSNYRNARERSAVSYLEASNFGRAASQTPRALRTAEIRSSVAIRGPLPVIPERASQGSLLQARSPSGSGSTLATLRRGQSSATLRDGTARVPFSAQRDRVRESVDQFRSGSSTIAAAGPSSRGRAASSSPRAAPSVVQARRAGSGSGRAAASPAGAGQTPARRAQPGAGSLARAGTSVRSPSPVFAPRSTSRIGAARQSAGGVSVGSARSPAQTVRRSGTLGAARTVGRSRPTFGTGGATRTSRASPSTRSSVYTPRNRAGSGIPSDPRASRGGSVGRSSASVYAPRTRSRASTRSSPSASSSRGTRPYGFPSGGASSSRYPRSGSSSGSYGRSSHPGVSSRSSSSSQGASHGRSSSSSSRSSASYGRSGSSSSRSSGSLGSRSAGSSSSVSRSAGSSAGYGGRSGGSSSGSPARR